MRIAVLTGDIVESTAMPADRQEAVIVALQTASRDAADWQGADLRFTRQKGDGWQLVLTRPRLSLRLSLFLQSAVRALGKGLATRISIAEGEGAVPAGPDLNSATGPVFVASGRGLDALEGDVRFRHASGGPLAAAVGLADHISQDWTPPQARAIHPMLTPFDPPRHSDVADHLGISRQAVSQALDAAGYGPLSTALTNIETAGTGN
ncbi:hypothetical protein [Tropicimonas isoalkanivorans]|uniref:SatD family (SatD) n=1 Tax=Tropicimonas isoalkanivorans TaxID=441112 RepID=A0A1I1G2Y9_9RHOB|nr:hypothetical protein [Tropicimonas isoalkanivorans]SFC04178.1 hypothetical protein SAMN04488094_102333 [Tropicimonas isoalkanivorans]